MSKQRSYPQREQDDNRGASGQFERAPRCEACGKNAGHDYYSDPETLDVGPLGLTLCDAKKGSAE